MYCCTPKALYNHVWGGSLLNHHQCAASTWMMRRLPQDNGARALTTHQLQVERRESHRDNQVYALTTHQLQVEKKESHRANQVYALTTHQLQVERRERDRANQVDGDYWKAMIDKGQWWEFGQDTGVTPLFFTRSAMGFLMTTESRDLGLTSHLKDGAFCQYRVPVTIQGC